MPSSLTTVALVQQQLGITTDDAILTTIVNGVNAGLENQLGETFAQTTYTNETYDFNKASQYLVFKHSPVISVTNLQYKTSPDDFEDTDWETIEAKQYDVDLNAGILRYNSNFTKGRAKYRVTYVAGYSAIPADLQLAATKIACSLYQNRVNTNVTSEALGQYSRTFSLDPTNWRKLGIDFILEQYVKRNWFTDTFRF